MSCFFMPQLKCVGELMDSHKQHTGGWRLFYENHVTNVWNRIVKTIWPTSCKKALFLPYANNKGADQPAHLRSLISTFVVRCLDSIISILAMSKISKPWLSLRSWAGRFKYYLFAIPWRQVLLWCGSYVYKEDSVHLHSLTIAFVLLKLLVFFHWKMIERI